MTAPETLEELRAAIERLADDHNAAAEDMTGRIAIGERVMHGTFVRRLIALLPPAPEPIKVGDRVECAHPGDFLALERPVVDGFTQDGTHVIVGNPDEGYCLYRLDFVRRVDQPHESEDPEELAAAVAAGLLVDFWGVLSKRWMRSGAGLSAEGYRRRLGKGERFQIHGTVPGYGETGGAS